MNNAATSNKFEGITADNQSQGGKVCQALSLTLAGARCHAMFSLSVGLGSLHPNLTSLL